MAKSNARIIGQKEILPITVTREVHLTGEDIDNILTVAFEGGVTAEWVKTVKFVGKHLGKYASEQISRGGELKLVLDEPGHPEKRLTQAKFIKGFKLWFANGGDTDGAIGANGDVDCCEIDAIIADAIVQYAVFGELVYG